MITIMQKQVHALRDFLPKNDPFEGLTRWINNAVADPTWDGQQKIKEIGGIPFKDAKGFETIIRAWCAPLGVDFQTAYLGNAHWMVAISRTE